MDIGIEPLIITLAGQKGGIGKSTLAIAIAVEWHRRGLRVLLVDGDDLQRTALTWAEVADELGLDVPQVVALGDDIRTSLPPLLVDVDVCIIDTPGRVGGVTTYALGVSHLAILPCGPTGPEIWAMDGTLEQARAVRDVDGKLDLLILVTRKQPGTVIGHRARVVLDDTEVPVLETELFFRVGYGEAITAGEGPTTYEPKSEAAVEVRALVAELEQRFHVSSRTVRALWRRLSRNLLKVRKRAS